jgi:tetratricopeptide (TPR) repeat protein
MIYTSRKGQAIVYLCIIFFTFFLIELMSYHISRFSIAGEFICMARARVLDSYNFWIVFAMLLPGSLIVFFVSAFFSSDPKYQIKNWEEFELADSILDDAIRTVSDFEKIGQSFDQEPISKLIQKKYLNLEEKRSQQKNIPLLTVTIAFLVLGILAIALNYEPREILADSCRSDISDVQMCAVSDLRILSSNPEYWKTYYEKVLVRDPKNYDANRMLAYILATFSIPPAIEESLNYLNAALQVQNDDAHLTIKGRLLWAKGSFPESESVLKDCLTRKPNDFPTLMDLANVLQRERKYDESKFYFRKARKVGWPKTDCWDSDWHNL